MEYKKSMIIIILAIFLLSIAGVCASDANDTVVASEDATAIELSQSEEITTTDESQKTIQTNGTEILTASDETTAAQNNPDTLSLEEKTYADLSNALGSGGDIDLQPAYFKYNGESRSITITNPGIINGNGAIIDMAGSNIQAFQVYVSGVTFKNMTIQNANFYDAGGAIFFNVGITGTVLNCNFVNNTVSGRGGAIYFNVESTGEVANCNFTDNKAAIGGGAVYFYDNGDVTNCNFINNTAEFCGAISLNNGTVTNCNFTNNNATGKNIEGGALGMNYGSVENCNFISNTAS